MTENEFWKHIEACFDEDPDTQYENLKQILRGLTRRQLSDFDRHYRLKLNAAYRWDLWGAAYIIQGGCSDDGFDYFCDWLISRGRDVFEAALQDPESLTGIAEEGEASFEDFRYAMDEIFEDKFGEDLPADPALRRPPEPGGEPFDESPAALEARYPKLFAHYWGVDNPDYEDAPPPNPKSRIWIFVQWGGAILSIISFLIFLNGQERAKKMAEIRAHFETPEFFAKVCETSVKWWEQESVTAAQVFKTELQSYQNVKADLPVTISRSDDGRERWNVIVKTGSDHFSCSDYAENYKGGPGRENDPELEKISE